MTPLDWLKVLAGALALGLAGYVFVFLWLLLPGAGPLGVGR